MNPAQNKKPTDDNTVLWAMLSHVSIALALILGPFCVLFPLIVWQVEKGKENPSKMLLFQSKQAFYYQLFVMLAGLVLGVVITILSLIIIGFLIVPIAIIIGIAALVYGIYAGIKVWQGEDDFKYYYLGDYLKL